MKLSDIHEIQHKFPNTNMDRSNTAGVLGTTSYTDIFRIHPNKGYQHPKPKKLNSKKINKEKSN